MLWKICGALINRQRQFVRQLKRPKFCVVPHGQPSNEEMEIQPQTGYKHFKNKNTLEFEKLAQELSSYSLKSKA